MLVTCPSGHSTGTPVPPPSFFLGSEVCFHVSIFLWMLPAQTTLQLN